MTVSTYFYTGHLRERNMKRPEDKVWGWDIVVPHIVGLIIVGTVLIGIGAPPRWTCYGLLFGYLAFAIKRAIKRRN